MGISIEWLRSDVGLARSGPKHRDYYDDYVSSLVIDGQGDVAVCKGLCVPPSPGDWRALEKMLRQRGYLYLARDVVREGRVIRRNVRRL